MCHIIYDPVLDETDRFYCVLEHFPELKEGKRCRDIETGDCIHMHSKSVFYSSNLILLFLKI